MFIFALKGSKLLFLLTMYNFVEKIIFSHYVKVVSGYSSYLKNVVVISQIVLMLNGFSSFLIWEILDCPENSLV